MRVFVADETVREYYNSQDDARMDLAGNAVPSISVNHPNSEAINNTGGETAPTLVKALVDWASLTLTCDEAPDRHSVPAAGASTVRVNGNEVALAAAAPVSVCAVTLTLAATVLPGAAVTLDYAVPAAASVQDWAGHEVGALSGRVVIIITADTADSPLVLIDVSAKAKTVSLIT